MENKIHTQGSKALFIASIKEGFLCNFFLKYPIWFILFHIT